MNKTNEVQDVVQSPKIDATCKKCFWGTAINPYHLKCGEFHEGKPYEVYWDGEPCPNFREIKTK